MPFAALCWISRQYRPALTPIAGTLLAFVGSVAVADVLGVNPPRSVWSTYQRMDGLLLLVHLAAFFFMLRAALREHAHWRWFFTVSIAASVVVGSVAFVEYAVYTLAGQVRRPGGPIGNGGLLAGYLMLHMFLCLLLLADERRTRVRAVLMAAMGFSAVVMYLTATRGALLALAVAVPLTAVAWHGPARVRAAATSRRVRTATGAAVAAVALLLLVRGVPLQRSFVRAADGVDQSVRLITWRAAWSTIGERPWLGWGQENFYVGWDRYFAPTGEPSFDRAHNMPLEWLLTGGVVVFAGWLVLGGAVARAIWRLSRDDRRTAVALAGLLGAYGVYAMFWFDAFPTLFLLVAVMAFVEWSLREAKETATQEPPAVGARWPAVAAAAVAAVVAVPAIQVLNVRPLLAARDTVSGMDEAARGRLAESLAYFDAALVSQGLRFPEIVEYMGDAATRSVSRYGAARPAEAKALADRAIRELQKLTAQPVVEAKHLRQLGTLAGAASRFDPSLEALALDSFTRSLALSPNPATYGAMAEYYAADGDYESAFDAQRKAMALAPASAGLRFQLVRLAFRAGVPSAEDYAAARRAFAEETALVRVAAQYVQSGDLELAQLAIEELLRRDPGNRELLAQRDALLDRLQRQRRGSTAP